MRLLFHLVRAYPGRSLTAFGCLLFAALAEGIGLSSLLPLFSLAIGGDTPTPVAAEQSWLQSSLRAAFAQLQLTPSIDLLCLVTLSGIALKAGFVLLAHRQVGYTVAHVATDLRLALLRVLLAVRWEYYIRQPVGSLTNAYATEATRAAQAYLHGATIIALSIQTTLYLSLLALTSWQATLGALAVGTIVLSALSWIVRMARRAGKRQTRLLNSLLGQLTDILFAVKPLKAMAREREIGHLLEHDTQRLKRALQREVLSGETLRALQDPLVIAGLLGGLYLALTRWHLPLETVIVLAILFERTLSSLNKVQKRYQEMVACESAFWALRETIDRAEAEREQVCGTAQAVLHNALTFRHVYFSYADQPILQDASFHIPAGQLTVIIGASGVGKTTTVDLITGLLRPQHGQVWIDDTALDTLDLRAWRRTVGYVPQEIFLLHDSTWANVTLGNSQLTSAAVETALRAAGAWDFVTALPQGLETRLGERGARLSGGQRQRIAIARALVHTPQLLILDEATASLDPDTETAIWATIGQLRGEMTILAITHQARLLESADCVYRLEHGRIQAVRLPTEVQPRIQAVGAR